MSYRPLFLISAERARQELLKRKGRFKFTCADPEMTDYDCLAVLTEELGEVARAVQERSGAVSDVHLLDLKRELVQVAAVAVAWFERLDKADI